MFQPKVIWLQAPKLSTSSSTTELVICPRYCIDAVCLTMGNQTRSLTVIEGKLVLFSAHFQKFLPVREGESRSQICDACTKAWPLHSQLWGWQPTKKKRLQARQNYPNSDADALSFPTFHLALGKWRVQVTKKTVLHSHLQKLFIWIAEASVGRFYRHWEQLHGWWFLGAPFLKWRLQSLKKSTRLLEHLYWAKWERSQAKTPHKTKMHSGSHWTCWILSTSCQLSQFMCSAPRKESL